jgi:hypothetical protein
MSNAREKISLQIFQLTSYFQYLVEQYATIDGDAEEEKYSTQSIEHNSI